MIPIHDISQVADIYLAAIYMCNQNNQLTQFFDWHLANAGPLACLTQRIWSTDNTSFSSSSYFYIVGLHTLAIVLLSTLLNPFSDPCTSEIVT